MFKKNGFIKWLVIGLMITLPLGIFIGMAAKGEPTENTVSDVPTQKDPKEGKERFTMLLVGSDDAAALSDVMMLLSIDPNNGEAWGMQIPRDTYAHYSEKGYRKLNGAASALGGMEQLRDFFEDSFGVKIDRYVRLSLEGFRRVVDALGGVEVTLPERLDYEDPAQGLSIHIPEGTQRLDGRTAEQFVRYRSGYTRGDLDRLDAQKIFLSALVRTVRENYSPVTVGKLALNLIGEMETDLTLSDVMTLAPDLLSIEDERIFFVTAPGEDVRSKKSGASFYVLSAKGMQALLSDHFGGKADGFDPNGCFLNKGDEDFSRIYDKEIPYFAASAGEKK